MNDKDFKGFARARVLSGRLQYSGAAEPLLRNSRAAQETEVE
ncbi:MAG: hypothetical protein ACJ76N_10340 [Thermoanaerobaculia bacterium]